MVIQHADSMEGLSDTTGILKRSPFITFSSLHNTIGTVCGTLSIIQGRPLVFREDHEVSNDGILTRPRNSTLSRNLPGEKVPPVNPGLWLDLKLSFQQEIDAGKSANGSRQLSGSILSGGFRLGKDWETIRQICFLRNTLSSALHEVVSVQCRFSIPHQPLGRFPVGRFVLPWQEISSDARRLQHTFARSLLLLMTCIPG